MLDNVQYHFRRVIRLNSAAEQNHRYDNPSRQFAFRYFNSHDIFVSFQQSERPNTTRADGNGAGPLSENRSRPRINRMLSA
jgi:hypothetical protein